MVHCKHQNFLIITKERNLFQEEPDEKDIYKAYLDQSVFLLFQGHLTEKYANEIHATFTPNYILIPIRQAQKTLRIMRNFTVEQWHRGDIRHAQRN
jgi:hypothetical protein